MKTIDTRRSSTPAVGDTAARAATANLSSTPNAGTRAARLCTAAALLGSLALVACNKPADTTTPTASTSASSTDSGMASPGSSTTGTAATGAATTETSPGATTSSGTADAGASMKDAAKDVGNAGKSVASDAADATKAAAADARDATADAMITTSVNAALAKDSQLSVLKINVDTSAGHVALKGSAPNAKAKDRAAKLASGVKGVVSVDNQLVVSPDKS